MEQLGLGIFAQGRSTMANILSWNQQHTDHEVFTKSTMLPNIILHLGEQGTNILVICIPDFNCNPQPLCEVVKIAGLSPMSTCQGGVVGLPVFSV